MVNIPFKLANGLKVGDVIHKDGELKELNIGEIFQVESESEELRFIGDEAVLVRSPAKFGLGSLRRQINKLGNLEMPLSDELFEALTKTDMLILQKAAEELDKLAYKQVLKRGRTHPGNPELLPTDE